MIDYDLINDPRAVIDYALTCENPGQALSRAADWYCYAQIEYAANPHNFDSAGRLFPYPAAEREALRQAWHTIEGAIYTFRKVNGT